MGHSWASWRSQDVFNSSLRVNSLNLSSFWSRTFRILLIFGKTIEAKQGTPSFYRVTPTTSVLDENLFGFNLLRIQV